MALVPGVRSVGTSLEEREEQIWEFLQLRGSQRWSPLSAMCTKEAVSVGLILCVRFPVPLSDVPSPHKLRVRWRVGPSSVCTPTFALSLFKWRSEEPSHC